MELFGHWLESELRFASDRTLVHTMVAVCITVTRSSENLGTHHWWWKESSDDHCFGILCSIAVSRVGGIVGPVSGNVPVFQQRTQAKPRAPHKDNASSEKAISVLGAI